jgi:hypothetical protein
MPQRRFPRPWRFEPIPGGYRVIDASGLALAHVYGEPPNAIAISDKRLTDNEAEKIARLIARLPVLVQVEKDRNRARSRRKPQPLKFNACDDRRPDQGRQAPRGQLLRILPAGAPPLYRPGQSRPAEADARAGGGQPSRLQRLRCQEQRHPSSDLGQTRREGRQCHRPLSRFH